MIPLSFDSLRSSIGLIKEARAFSKPWFKGEDYDLSLSFDSLRSLILDSANLVHHMDSAMRLVVEDDVGDAEQEACVLTRWSNPGRVTLKMKGEESKATPVLGRSSNGPTRHGCRLT